MGIKNQSFDTSMEAEAIMTKLIQQQTPADRLAGAIAASNRVAQQCKDAILRANPDISRQEIKLRFIAINYGQELADDVRNFLAEKT